MVHRFLVFLQHLNATAKIIQSIHIAEFCSPEIRLNHEGPVACSKSLQLCIFYSQFINSYLCQFPLCQFLI